MILNNNLDVEAEKLLDTISANVIKARQDKGYSQLKLATEMGYSSASYFGRIEIRKDGQHFNIVQLYKIATILDIDICSLLNSDTTIQQ